MDERLGVQVTMLELDWQRWRQQETVEVMVIPAMKQLAAMADDGEFFLSSEPVHVIGNREPLRRIQLTPKEFACYAQK